MSKFLLFGLVFTLLRCIPVVGRTVGTLSDLDSLLGCMSRVVSATRHVVQEKVYLHFDNTGYFMGEKMWFTAYVVRADGHRPGVRSRVLYVELLNPGGDVVQRRKLKIDERGHAHGDLSLDSLYGTGFYEVRAFTRYMANWGGAACFSRVFPVFRAPSSPGAYEPVIDERSYRRRLPDFREPDTLHRSRLNVSFYPEGGRLVSGLRSRVAFQVSDGGGRHVSADGELLDGEGRVVVRGFSDSTGRGVFTVPASCDGLRFRLRDARGRFKEFPLPESSSEGCVLELPPSLDDSLRFSVRGTASYRDRLLGYMLMNYGRVWSCDTFRVGSGYQKSYFRDSLPEGVNQLTVFDGRGRILCERLFFLFPKPSTSDTIRVTSETARLTPCGKVRLRLHAIPGSVFGHLLFGDGRRHGVQRPWPFGEVMDAAVFRSEGLHRGRGLLFRVGRFSAPPCVGPIDVGPGLAALRLGGAVRVSFSQSGEVASGRRHVVYHGTFAFA